ncbi:MAG: diguanylate cyclase [Lachnospiraceae bacterium]|nr:diguanylate cyclase [Lachnospiraceae bacterium]
MDMKEKIERILSYFEGTCEICLGNIGIEKYRKEIGSYLAKKEIYDEETRAVLLFTAAVIEYKLENLDDAKKLWEEALELAKKNKMKTYVGKIYSYLSIIYYVNGERELEKKCFLKACKIFEELGDDVDMALHYTNALWYKRYDKNTKEIVDYLNRAIEYAGKTDSDMNARVYLHIGYIYKTIFNDFIRGIHYLLMSNKMCRENDWVEMETMTFHVLADGYLQLWHYNETIEIYTDIVTNPRYKDITPNLKCAVETNLVTCYLLAGDMENAEKYLLELEKNALAAQVNIREQFMGVADWLRAWLYIDSQNEQEKIIELLDEAYEIYKKHEKSFVIENFEYRIKEKIADYYLSVGDIKKAIAKYKELEKIAKDLGDATLKIVCGKLADAYETIEDYKHSLEYRKKEDKYFSSVNKHNVFSQYEKMYKDFFNSLSVKDKEREDKIKKEFKSKAYVDKLTGCKNAAYLEKFMESYKIDVPLFPGKISFIVADIDDFSTFNDRFGKKNGDELLERTSYLIRDEFGLDNANFIRYEADTFVVITEDVEGELVKKLSKDLIKRFKEDKMIKSKSDNMTISVGACIGRISNEEDARQAWDYAQKELYKVKRIAKGNAAFYEDEF